MPRCVDDVRHRNAANEGVVIPPGDRVIRHHDERPVARRDADLQDVGDVRSFRPSGVLMDGVRVSLETSETSETSETAEGRKGGRAEPRGHADARGRSRGLTRTTASLRRSDHTALGFACGTRGTARLRHGTPAHHASWFWKRKEDHGQSGVILLFLLCQYPLSSRTHVVIPSTRCHPERSEGSAVPNHVQQIPRSARDDTGALGMTPFSEPQFPQYRVEAVEVPASRRRSQGPCDRFSAVTQLSA